MVEGDLPSPYLYALFLPEIRCAGKYSLENIRGGHLVWADDYVKLQEKGLSTYGVSYQCIGASWS